ncbi:BlaI/MecI/CopY family transcriptional regulator [Arenivirga flava]|uniref:Penicillinase repressor n=1 Tax=Arenivirga flava TaxID=1930060 RepID=A0AA37XAD3_9MICO|nr:BlaI/MecI/CopY family transcriptional regulator [Arenivirga flava]GMA29744.1 penicillinase repressor [Arenivirga flava]
MRSPRSRQRGELESAVMDLLWDAGRPLTAREVQESVEEPQPAITTVLTVLERLREKGWVDRESGSSRGLLFAPTLSREHRVAGAMATALASTSDRSAALMQFAGELSIADRDLLRAAIAGNAAD